MKFFLFLEPSGNKIPTVQIEKVTKEMSSTLWKIKSRIIGMTQNELQCEQIFDIENVQTSLFTVKRIG